jgi:hypothetical protein
MAGSGRTLKGSGVQVAGKNKIRKKEKIAKYFYCLYGCRRGIWDK